MPVIIREIHAPREKEQAQELILRIAMQTHNASPPPPPQILFGAFVQDRIVGTLGLDFGTKRRPLPLESIFIFTDTPPIIPENRRYMAQFGRWMSEMPNAGIALSFAAVTYSIKKNRKEGWCELKDDVAAMVGRGGMKLQQVPYDSIRYEVIPTSGLPYYQTPPVPQLYRFGLKRTRALFKPRIERLRGEGFSFI